MTNGINTLKAADNGLTSITTTLQSMQATVTQARQDASWQSTSWGLDTAAIGTTTAKSIALSGGAVGATPVQIALNTTGATPTSSGAGVAFSSLQSVFAPTTSGSITAPTAYNSSPVVVGNSMLIWAMDAEGNALTYERNFLVSFDGTTDGSTPISAGNSPGNPYSEAEAIQKINHDLAAQGSTIRAGDPTNSGYITLSDTATGAASNVVCASAGAGFSLKQYSTNGADAGTGVGFTVAVNGGGAHAISVARADVIGAGIDNSNGGINSVNLTAAINTKLAAAGIANVAAVKSGTAGISAGTDTISLQATTPGPGTTFTLSAITGSVIGGLATATSSSAGAQVSTIIGLPQDDSASVGFDIAVPGVNNGAAQTISINYSDLTNYGIDDRLAGSAQTSMNLTAAINHYLAADGITSVIAVKSGTPYASAATDTVSLQATTPGSGTTFTLSNIIGNVVGGTVTAGADSSTTVTPGTNGGSGSVKTVDQLVADINGNAGLAGYVRASNNAGQLQITNLATSALTLTGVTSSGTIDGGTGTGTVAANTTRSNLVVQFNQLRDQLDKTAQDSSFNGINLLAGDQLKLYFNENSTSYITIQSTNTAGVNSSTLGAVSATDAEFQSNSLLDSRLQSLQTAVTTVASQASAFGNNLAIVQNRQTFTNAMINTLQTGADGLTLADTNLEGANMLSLQTSQQLSIQALSLASQSNQAVLRLFG